MRIRIKLCGASVGRCWHSRQPNRKTSGSRFSKVCGRIKSSL